MAIDNQTMELIKGIVAQELKNATSLQDAAQGIAKGVTQYVGARYVPLFANPPQWTNDREYEPLTIVLYQGNSFTSMQFVPAGIDIGNEEFWAQTGNYNAQIEQYRQEVKEYAKKVTEIENTQQSQTDSIKTLTAKQQQTDETIKTVEEKVATNTNSITELENGAKYNGITGHVTNAAALFRTKGDYSRQGGCPCGNDLYAIYVFSVGESKVMLYKVSTGEVVSTYNVGDTEFHGNGMSYYNGELILAGSDPTSKGSKIYFFQVTNSSLKLSKTLDAAQIGLDTCWGFGHYKDTDEEYYWATDTLWNFYYVNKACTSSSKIGTVYLPESAGQEYSTQQACSYSKEYGVFLSSRSNCINVFTDSLKYIKTIPIDETLGFVWREEIEQVTIYDGKLWMHNTPFSTTAYTDTHIGCVWSVDVGTEMPKGWGYGYYNNNFTITFDGTTQVPTSSYGNPNKAINVGYMQDVSAVQAQLGKHPYDLNITASSNDVLLIQEYTQINAGQKTWAGIYALAGYTIYECYNLMTNLKNARYTSLFAGIPNVSVTLFTEFPAGVEAGGKKVFGVYGGMLIVRNQNSIDRIKAIDGTPLTYAIMAIE